jgi:hypothetical protein
MIMRPSHGDNVLEAPVFILELLEPLGVGVQWELPGRCGA